MSSIKFTKMFERWASLPSEHAPEVIDETCNEVPEIGDTVRTNKKQIDGKVERISESGEVFFRIADGRLMKTHYNNVTVVEKLADEDSEIMENEELLELSNELLSKYKTSAADSSRAADAMGDIKKSNKRFSGVVKATNKQFANDVKKSATAEGSMGGINRSRPAQDVSYEKVLDRNPESKHSRVIGEDNILNDIMEKWNQLNELSVGTLKSYAKKASGSAPEHDKVKTVNHVRGYHKAKDKIAIKTGDRTSTREAEDPFKKQLNKQHKEIKKTEEKDYNGWKIRYQLAPSTPGAPLQWMVWHDKGSTENAHKGTSSTPQKALDDATAWINSGDGEKKTANKNITIDFNTNFSQQFAPGNEIFYATIDDGYLLFSVEPQQGLKQSVKRHGDRYSFQSITLTPRESNAAGLVPHGRYALGPPEDYSPGIQMFPIQFQGTAAHSGDKLRMGSPGFTAATERDNDLEERLDPWHGYTSDDKKANALSKAPKSSFNGTTKIPLSQMIQDTINSHGVKWAFDYYVVKHGLPPRQFRIFSGI